MRRKKTAKQIIEREARYPTVDKRGYEGFADYMDKHQKKLLNDWEVKNPATMLDVNDYLAVYKNHPPIEFSKPYVVSDEACETHLNNVQNKYLQRFKNARRAWCRIMRFLPEAMNKRDKLRVLEMSTAHGATLEVLRYFGHDVVGNDFSNEGLGRAVNERTTLRDLNTNIAIEDLDRKDWPYKPLIESLDLDVRLFDAGIVPYPFESSEFDVVLCFDALEHYCHPKDWMDIIDEFVRISKRTVVIKINPVRREHVSDEDYMPFVHVFIQKMMDYEKSGFRCVVTDAEYNQPLYFKLMKLYDV